MSDTMMGEVEDRKPSTTRRGPIGHLSLFFRQVFADLRKVVRPTRTELITYTAVCLVFVTVVMAYVSGLDLALGAGVVWVFGG
ncbi:MAG: preprotein translocase subunit SecE [Angustibacter sp.]